MSRAQKAFYGYSERPTVAQMMAELFALTGSESCAKELAEAADFVELACAGKAFSHMPEWIS